MSWVVEQSESTAAVSFNGDTVTCTQDGHYGSPVNVMYDDPADQNGQYFWQLEFQGFDGQGNVSVGLTTQQGFKAGWALKAMKYLGNLSDGGALLVSEFGDRIKSNDKVGLLLQLTDAELKLYIFHNDRPLGLAFHVQAPYPKPLYPVVGFSSNGTVKIARSQQIPTSLNRTALQFTGIEGTWKITDYPQHPECAGVQFELKKQNENIYDLYTHVVNSMNCSLEHNPSNNQWKASGVLSTRMGGPPDLMRKESVVGELISNIQSLDVQGEQELIIQTNNGEQVLLERFTVPGPQPVTQNIFN
jgi:hypothetical protein